MNQKPRNQHSVRRIVLPSGRSIEVVRFHDSDALPSEQGLHVCPRCHSELVQPVAWGEVSSDRWELTLHCPDCEWLHEDVYDQDQVAALEEKLDEGVEALLRDLQRLTHANMADQVERFSAALQAGLILPEDF
jgi:hypothetical protein